MAGKFIILEGTPNNCAIFKLEKSLPILLTLKIFALICEESVVIMINASTMSQLGDWVDWALVFLGYK